MNLPLTRHPPSPAYPMEFPMTEPRPKFAIELPTEERGRGPDDIRRLDRLNAKLRRTDLTDKQREATAKERDRLEQSQVDSRDAAWRDKAIGETIALADARGVEIEQERSGLTRVVDADPLFKLACDNRITPEQLDVGRQVRDLYDSRAQDAGAMEYTGMPGAAHDHEKFVASRFTRAKASEFIGRIERAIAIHCSAEPACLVALRAICERGWPMASMGKGRAYERNCAAFARALDVADKVLRRQL